MTLVSWSWFFLVIYTGGMIAIGVLAQRRVKHADDFAHGAWLLWPPVSGPWRFSATTVSGATLPGHAGAELYLGG